MCGADYVWCSRTTVTISFLERQDLGMCRDSFSECRDDWQCKLPDEPCRKTSKVEEELRATKQEGNCPSKDSHVSQLAIILASWHKCELIEVIGALWLVSTVGLVNSLSRVLHTSRTPAHAVFGPCVLRGKPVQRMPSNCYGQNPLV